MDDVRATLARNGFVRSSDRGILGGVCSGLGRRFGLGPWMSRLLFVVLLMVLPGSQFLVYPLLWFLMPSDDSAIAASHSSRPLR